VPGGLFSKLKQKVEISKKTNEISEVLSAKILNEKIQVVFINGIFIVAIYLV
jgi:hypothetical protein